MNINYREDFLLRVRLTDCEGQRVERWPECEFAGVISTSGAARFRFGRRGTELYNCMIDPDDAGVLLIPMDGHGLPPGRLRLSIDMLLPDAMMPDGTRRVVLTAGGDDAACGCGCAGRRIDMEDVTLVWGASDCAEAVVIEATAPFVVRTAYDMARQLGYDGTASDYEAALSALPAVAQTSAAVASMAADLAEGKRRVISEINTRGIGALPADAPLSAVAEAIHEARLAVEGEPELVLPAACGMATYDLLNEVRNHQLADYPYCSAVRLSYRDVLLEGADAYLCSDGFFCETPPSGEATEHTFDDWGEHYIIYYYRSPNYAFQPDDNAAAGMRDSSHTHLEWLIYSGNDVTLNTPSVNLYGAFKACHGGRLILTAVGIGQATEVHLKVSGFSGTRFLYKNTVAKSISIDVDVIGVSLVSVCEATTVIYTKAQDIINGVWGVNSDSVTERIVMPELNRISSGSIARQTLSLREIDAPNLIEMTDEGRILWNDYNHSFPNYSKLNLPRLKKISGKSEIDNNITPALQVIDLPALESIEDNARLLKKNTQLESAKTFNLPKLKRIASIGGNWDGVLYCVNMPYSITLNMPEVEYIRTYLFCGVKVTAPFTVNLGAQQEAERIHIAFSGNLANVPMTNVVTVQPGFRSALDISRFGCTAESLSALIANLADNNGHATLQLTLGSGNISRLTEEDIAVAQAKNYTIA